MFLYDNSDEPDQQHIEYYRVHADQHGILYIHDLNLMHHRTLLLQPRCTATDCARSVFSVVGNYSVINASTLQRFVACHSFNGIFIEASTVQFSLFNSVCDIT